MTADLADELHDALDDLAQPVEDDDAPALRMGVRATIGTLPLAQIHPRSDQPRRSMDAMALEELTASIRSHGVLQPIRVRSVDGEFEIIAGERRWTAAQAAGLTEIPAVVVTADDDQAFVEALVENVQREDLNPVDRAAALVRLRTAMHLDTWAATGAVIGLHRVTIQRLLGIAHLPPDMQEDVRAGTLTEKHARALLSLRHSPQQQSQLWKLIHARELSGDAAIVAAKGLKPETISAKERAPETQIGAFKFREAGESTVTHMGGATIELGRLAVVQLADGGSKTTSAGMWLSAMRSDLVAFRSACTEGGDTNGWRLALDMVREVMAGGPTMTRGMAP